MKKSDRTGLQDSGTTTSGEAETPNKDNRITSKNYVADGEDPFAALVDQLADTTEVAA